MAPAQPRLRRLATGELRAPETEAIRAILFEAFGTGEEAFAEDDWTHALGGQHFVLDIGDRIVCHGSVVERWLRIGGRPIRTGYVEAVATAPELQGRGYGTVVMQAATEYIRDAFELGALGTGRHDFYGRLGWETWRGRAFVRSGDCDRRTPEDEGYIMVLRTPASFPFACDEPIGCDDRVGEAW